MLHAIRRPRVAGLLILLVLAGGALLRPAPAQAHAELAQSDPPAQSSLARAPSQVQLLFTEPVEARSIEVSVLNRSRERVDGGDARLAPNTNDTVLLSLGDLPPGVYTISWKVTSAIDGHTTRGLVPFGIGDAGAVPEPLSEAEIGAASSEGSDLEQGPLGVVARWLTLLSMLALGGLLVARLLLQSPVEDRLRAMAAGRDDTAITAEAPAGVARAANGRLLRLCWLALALFLAGSLLLLVVNVAARNGDDLGAVFSGSLTDYFRTRNGALWLLRAGLGVILAALLLRPAPEDGGVEGGPLGWLPAVAAGGMLLTTSLGSHSAALDSGAALGTAVDWVHLVAGALWIGGLIYLALVLLPALAPLGGPARTRVLAFLVPRFSTIAGASVGVLVLTGVFQWWQLSDTLRGIADLQWGRALLVKLVLVLALLGLAAINLLYVRPRLAAYAQRMDRATRERAAAVRLTFRRVVLAEAGVGVLVLLAVGVLTGVPPSEATLNLPAGPFRPFVLDERAEDLSGRLVISPGRIGPNRFDLTVSLADGGTLTSDASAVLRITTLDQDTGIAEARLETLGPGRFTAAGTYLSTAGLWEVAAIVRRPGRDDVTMPFRLSLSESTGQAEVQESRPAAPLARGREIYQANCIQCHGIAGRGDGPLAASLRPPPVDLTVHVPLHTDGTLTGWIANGIPRTAMPAFGSQFSPEEIQATINYLRDLARQSGQDR